MVAIVHLPINNNENNNLTNRNKGSSYLLSIEDHLLRLLLIYFDAKSLCNLSITCKYCNKTIDPIFEEVWWQLCLKGWSISEKEKFKLCGIGSSMKYTYRMLWQRMRIPRGRYTERFNYIFGKGRNSNVSCWISLGHSSNAELYNLSADINGVSTAARCVDMRLCIQNLGSNQLIINYLDPQQTVNLTCLDQEQEDDVDQQSLTVTTINEIARNGQTVSSPKHSSMSCLNPLEFIVLSCKVQCPPWVRYETDFLSMMDRIELKINHAANDNTRGGDVVTATMIPENEIWEYYIELPGGVVLLRDKPLYSVM